MQIPKAISVVLSSSLRGAGDTRFILKMSVLLSIGLFVIPSYLYIRFFDANLMGLWWIITLNVLVYVTVFFFRFYKGPWKNMRVI